AAVVVPAAELTLPPNAAPGGEGLVGADSICRAVECLRILHEARRAGSEAALCVLDNRTALVADWVQDRVYHVELEMHRCAPVAASTELASSAIGAAWLEIRRSSWARAANLRDPE